MVQKQPQFGALEEMVLAHLLFLRENPLEDLEPPWFEAVTELLLAMHPEVGVWWRHRVRQELHRHAVLHGCQAVGLFDSVIEEALRVWIHSES